MEGRTRVVVRKLRLHSQAAFAGSPKGRALAQWVKGTLQGAELEPAGMPPSAVLLVRRLEGPAAGPPLGLGRAGAARWEADVRERIGRSYAEASRPVRGELPSDAAAVLFRDPAEMTAALLLDVARGNALDRWWWPCAIEERTALQELSRAFLRELRHVPAAVAYLISWGRAEEVARALSPREARMLAARLCSAFGLAELALHFDDFRFEGSRSLDAMDPVSEAGSSLRARFDEQGGSSAAPPGDEEARLGPPWGDGGRGAVGGARRESAGTEQGFEEEHRLGATGRRSEPGARRPRRAAPGLCAADRALAGPALLGGATRLAGAPWSSPALALLERTGRERAALFGIAALLARSPHTARSGGFATRFTAWWQGSQRVERRAGDTGGSGSSSELHSGGGRSGGAGGGRPSTQRPGASQAVARGLEPPGPGASRTGGPDGAGGKGPFEAAADEPHGAVGWEQSGPASPGTFLRFEEEADAPPAPWSSEQGCATGLGGILYLLNAMKRLQIPGCFAADWRLDSALGPWGCLQALAIGLLARPGGRDWPLQAKEIWNDPIWRLLAALEGRELDQPLGAGVVDPGGFSPPEAWRRLLDPAYSEPLQGTRWAEVERECPLSVAPALRRWIAGVLPYLEAYIRTAAGPLAGPDFDAAALLFVQGRIYATRSHVDLVTSLDEISLAARVAGLDADPGWDPLLGRVVQFHFR